MQKDLLNSGKWRALMLSTFLCLWCYGSALADNTPALTTTSISGLPASICESGGSLTLSGSPSGGTFSGPGISGNTFNPGTAGPGTHTIVYNPPGYRVGPIVFSGSSGGGTTISLGDNTNTGAIGIGFNFNFYGSNYSNLYIHSNGFISFSPGQSNSTAVGNTALPNGGSPNNLIAFAMNNMDPGNGLQGAGANRLWYQRQGSAPNRRFIYNFRLVDQFSSGSRVTGRVILFESTNVIEIHLQSRPSNGTRATEGVENSNGTQAVTVGGRNSAFWSAFNSSHRFVPQVVATQQVVVFPSPNLSFSTTGISCAGNNDGAVNLSVSSGQAPYSYNWSNGANSQDLNNVGAGTYTVTVTDNRGCTEVGSATVVLNDNTPPNAVCQNVTIALNASGNASINANNVDGGSSDACGIQSRTINRSSFTCSDVGNNNVTLTVTDVNGNSSSCTAVVTVVDNMAPEALCQNVTATLGAGGTVSVTANQVNNGSMDNCSISTTTINRGTFNCNSLGANPVTLTVTDPSGNTDNCNATITVIDPNSVCNQAPNAVCQNITVSANGSCQGTAVASAFDGGSNDPDNDPLTFSVFPAGPYSLGTTGVTLTVTDPDGATDQCTANITVVDNTPPVANCQNVTVSLNAGGNASITATQINNGSSDNCSLAAISVSPSSFNCNNLGSNTVTFTVTDGSGNQSSCTATVTVQDNIAPNAICTNTTVSLSASGTASIAGSDIDGGSSDNCAVSSLSVSPSSFDCSNIGANTVTLTVSDASGNSSTCTAVVTVEDNAPPTITCPGSISVSSDAGVCQAAVTVPAPTASDNCTGLGLTITNSFNGGSNASGTYPVGTTNVTYTVTDASGNSSNCTVQVTVADNQNPSALCNNVTVQLDAGGNASVAPGDVDGGSNDACGVGGSTVNPSSFACTNLGNNSVTLTVTDVNGNAASCNSTVAVEDNLPPAAVCQPVTVQLDGSGNGTIAGSDVNNGSSDNCTVSSVAVTPNTFGCADLGNNGVTLTVTDQSGNSDNCTAVATVVDSVSPTAVCQDVTVQLDASGNGTLTAASVDNGSNDNCSVSSLSIDNNSFDCSNVGNGNTTTLTVTDGSGNQSSCTATVTVEDNIAPIAICQNLNLQLDANGSASTTAAAVNNGSSDACGIASLSLDKTTFTCANLGPNTVTLTVTDNNGNTSTCTATITINDPIPPVANCQDVTVQLDANGAVTVDPAIVNNGSTDNCSIDNLLLDNTNYGCTNVDSLNMVVLTVIDPGGNTDTCSASITVEDNIAPNAICQDLTVQLGASGNGVINAGLVDNGSNDACGIASVTLTGGSYNCSDIGSTTETLTVTDVNGNVSTCSSIITIEDNISPVVQCQNVTIQLDAGGNASVTAAQVDNGSSDACGIASLVLSQDQFDCSEVGANSVVLVVSDVNGNSGVCFADIVVEDNLAPNALCQDVTVQLNGSGTGSITTADVDNGSNDNCGVASLSLDSTNFDCAAVGNSNPVTLSVVDVNNNTSSCTATVTVEDNIAPIAVCQNVTVQLGGNGQATVSASDINNGSSDNCGIGNLSLDQTSFSCGGVGNNNVALTVTDVNGNSSGCTAIVTIEDNVAPNAVCQNLTVQLDAAGNASITAQDVDGGSSDNCNIAGLSIDNSSFTCSDVGANTVTLTVTDANGNSSTCTSTVNVEDNTDPIAVCQDVTVQLDANGQGSITAANVDNGSSDACGIASLSLDNTTFSCGDVGSNTVTLTVTDVNTNSSSCTATITVEDNVDPIAVCQDITVQLDAAGQASIVGNDVDGGSNDACGIASLSVSPTSFNCSNVGSGNSVILVVTDNNGNTSNCTSQITVEDNIAPVAICQDVTIQLDANGAGSITPGDVDNGSNDACGIGSLSLSNTSFGCLNVAPPSATPASAWINELHYDNNGSDVNESAEIAGPAGLDLTGWSLVLYNGLNGAQYNTISISGTLPDQSNGFGTLNFATNNIQNGDPDGLALVDDQGTVVEFLSYEGSFTAINGPASGMTSTDIGVSEPASLALGNSLQLIGTGSAASDFTWSGPSTASSAAVNSGQTFIALPSGNNTVVLTVTDVNGNTDTCSANITVEDPIAPIAVCQDITIQLDGSGNAIADASNANGGSTDACGINSFTLDDSLFTCADLGSNTQTLTVEDVNGNTSTCSTTITVEDSIAPVALCQNITVQLDVSGNATINSIDVNGGSTDNCAVTTYLASDTTFDCANVGGAAPSSSAWVNEIHYDDTGSDQNEFVEIAGNAGLDLTGWTLVLYNGSNGNTYNSFNLSGTIANQSNGFGTLDFATTNIQNGNPDGLALVDDQGTVVEFLSYEGTFTGSNGPAAGLTSTDIGVNEPASQPSGLSVQLSGSGSAASDFTWVAPAAQTQGQPNNNQSFQALGGNSIILTVGDVSGNTSSCTAFISVEDNIAPVAVCQDVTVQLDANGAGSTTAMAVDNGSNDACGIDTLTLDNSSFACADVGANTVTLTAADVNGNSSTCTAQVTVEDNIAPVAICQDITVQLDPTGNASITPQDVDNGSNDACGIASLALDNTTFNCNGVTTSNTVTLTVTDVNGNISTCTANVSIEDSVAPIALCQDVTVQLDANGAGSITPQDVDNGSNDNCAVASLALDNTTFACTNVGNGNTVTLTVTDVNSNQSSCTATVTVEDNIAPIAICQDLTVQLDPSGSASITAGAVDNGSNDACGIGGLSLDNSTFGCADVGSNTVTLTATDVNGNSATCTSQITVLDSVSPTAICQDITVQLDPSGNGSTTASAVDNGSNDNCAIANLSLSQTTFDCSEVGPNTETLTVTDVNGNTSTCTAVVTVEDNISPNAVCQNVTVYLDGNGNGSTTAQDVGGNSTDACGIASLILSQTDFDCSEVGLNGVILIVNDVNGNNSACFASVQVEDTVAPIAICQDITVQLDANGQASITEQDIDNGSNDACGIASLSVSPSSFDCANTGNNTVSLTVTDVNGNVTTCGATVTVEDNIAPAIVCPADVSISCVSEVPPVDINSVTVTDNCAGASVAHISDTDNGGLGCTGNPRIIDRLYQATDASGNTANCSQLITIVDTIPPVITCPPAVTINCTDPTDPTTTGAATATDNCIAGGGGSPAIMYQLADSLGNTDIQYCGFFPCFFQDPWGSASLFGTGTNYSINVSTGQFWFVEAVAYKVGNSPSDFTLDASGVPIQDASWTIATAPAPTANFSQSITIPDTSCKVVAMRVFIIRQEVFSGLDASSRRSVYLYDPGFASSVNPTTSPYLEGWCPSGSPLPGGPAITFNDVSVPRCGNTQQITRTFTATDTCGNNTSCTQVITTQDVFPPVITCPADITVNNDPGLCGAAVSFTPTAVDECGTTVVSTNIFSGSNFPAGTTTVTAAASDECGNVSLCTFDVTVIDAEAPNAVCQDITVQLDGSGNASITVADVDGGSTDNCVIDTIFVNPTTFNCSNVAGNTVTLTVTDTAGNTSTCTANVTIEDSIAPNAVCQDITIQLDAQGAASITAADVDGGSSDNCGIAGSSLDNTNFGCGNVGGNTVTLTVTDVNGNSSICTANVEVEDNVAPIALCQDVTVQLDGSGNGTVTAQNIDNGSNDACGIASLSLDNTAFGCSNVGSSNTVTLTVTDNNGNASSCTSTVTVEDNIAPIAICQDITVQLNASGSVSITPQDIDNGSNDACGIASLNLDITTFNCNNVNGNTVTLTVTDVNGNASTCTAQVTVLDTVPPVTVCQDITVQLDASGNATIVPADVDGGSSSNCGIASLTLDNDSFDCSNVGTNTVTLTATDVNGNTSTCTAQVTVEDNIAPVAICQDVTVQLDANGQGGITTTDVDNGSNDACGIASLSLDNSSFGCGNVGGNTVTLTVTDNNGNSSSCTSTITVEDNIDPIAVCQDITVQLDASGNATITASDVDNGSNDACGIASLSIDNNSFNCQNVGSGTVTLTATDVNGNSASCVANVTILDSVSPTALCQNITVQLDAQGTASITAADVDGGSNDNCGIANLSLDNTTFGCGNVGQGNTVTLTVTDVNGNVSTCTANVAVEDNVAPVAICQDVTVQLDANGQGSITTSDVDNGSSDACGIASLSLDNSSFACGDVGGNTVTLTVTDNNGNSSSCTSTITVEDNIDPIAVCQDITVQLDANGSASITASDVDGGSNDACGIASLSIDNNSFNCQNVGSGTVTLTATDVNGNSASCVANVTILDSVSPTALCQNITVQLDAQGTASITAADVDGGSNDNCGIANLSLDNTTFGCGNVGQGNTVTLTVTDVNGNVSTCTANVAVEDNVAPVAICQDVTVQLDANGQGSITTSDVDNGSSDACGIASLSLDNSSFACGDVGGNTVTLTVTDNNGNVSSCSSAITVEDNVDPVAICQDITVQLDASGNATITASDVDNGSNDACGIASLSLDNSSFDCQNVGANSVALTATDVNGNSSTCTANVEVQDNIAPNAVCQDITLQLDGNGQASITAGDVDGGSNDNCGIASLAVSPSTFDCNNVNTGNTVTLTVTDVNGNVSTCTSNITVEDNVSPTAVCQDITVQLNSNGTASITGADVDGGSSDNCSISSLSVTPSSFDCQDVGSQSVTLTVTDVNGNSSTCAAQVTVEDNVSPVAICQDLTIQLDVNGQAGITAQDIDNGSNDACGVSSLSLDNTSFACANVGSNTITLTVTDVNGNSSTCTAQVTVEDNIDPVAICQNVTVQLDVNGQGSVTPQDIDNGSNDACGIASMSVSPNTFDCSNIGSNSVTLTVTDNNGNSSTCSAQVTVEDNIAPNAICQDITVYLDNNGAVFVSASDLDGGSSDGCGPLTFTTDAFAYGCGNVGNNTATLYVTDANGNVDSCTSTITVLDTIPPSFSCVNTTVYLDGTGNTSINALNLVTNLSDNCGSVICTCDSSQTLDLDCSNVGTFNQVVVVTDVNGNADSCTTQITVIDSISPTIVCPSDTTFQCVADVPVASVNDAYANDNCDPNPVITVVEVDNGGAGCLGSPLVIDRTYTATDIYGNAASCTQTIDVNFDTLVAGSCSRCDSRIELVWDCTNPSCVYVSSCKDLSNIVFMDVNGDTHRMEFNGAPINSGYFCTNTGEALVTVWVKAGCYQSGDGPGYGHRFDLCGSVISGPSNSRPDLAGGTGAAGGLEVNNSFEAFPNPFMDATQLRFSMGTDARVTLKIYDLRGVEVANLFQGAVTEGEIKEFEFRPENLARGFYIARLTTEDGTRIEKKLLFK